MAFTKITAAGIGSTETVTLDGLTVINDVSIGGTLTYEDVTNIDSVGLITARNGVVVGSGITLSKDGDIFATGVTTATTFVGNLTGAATQVTVADESSDTSCNVLYTTAASGNLAPKSGTNLTFNSSSGALTATSFVGDGSALTGVANTDVIFTDKISLPDSSDGSINIGVGSDFKLLHNGTDSFITEVGGGDLIIQGSDIILRDAGTLEKHIEMTQNGAVDLYHNGSKKLETTSSGVTVTGTVTDSNGNLRSIPLQNETSAHVLQASAAGRVIYISTGGVTVNPSVMSGNEAVTIINNSGSDQTITQGSSMVLYYAADGSSGNRTLAGRGMATIWFADHDKAYISGAGLS